MAPRKRIRRRSTVTPVQANITAEVRTLVAECPDTHPEIWARWQDIAGEQMYRRTFPIKYRAGVLTVGVANSTWLQQLSFLKENLRNRLDEEVGPGVVTEIRFILDRAAGTRLNTARATEKTPKKKLALQPPTPQMLNNVSDIEDNELAQQILRAMQASAARQRNDT